jgi:hypothetical protein
MNVAVYAGAVALLGIGYELTCSGRSAAKEHGGVRITVLSGFGVILMLAGLTLYALLLT